MRINAYLEVSTDARGVAVIRCRQCNASLGPADSSYKNFSAEARKPLPELGPRYAARESRFELREYYCPSCFVLLDVEVALRDDPVLHDVELHAAPAGSRRPPADASVTA